MPKQPSGLNKLFSTTHMSTQLFEDRPLRANEVSEYREPIPPKFFSAVNSLLATRFVNGQARMTCDEIKAAFSLMFPAGQTLPTSVWRNFQTHYVEWTITVSHEHDNCGVPTSSPCYTFKKREMPTGFYKD